MNTDPDGQPYRHNAEQHEAHKAALTRPKLGFWRRLMCRVGLCGGYVDHARDAAGTWWLGLRCATCGTLNCPQKSAHQNKH